jgi:60 kDa SS-A/Ro ribonucleoprotein
MDLCADAKVMTNAKKLAAIGGGGTNCSAPLAWLNRERAPVDLFVFVSDNQSWMDAYGGRQTTAVMAEWTKLKVRNPHAKLVCIDIQPYGTTQAPDSQDERDDVLNVGGFSDAVFAVIAEFAAGRLSPRHWVGEIEKIEV